MWPLFCCILATVTMGGGACRAFGTSCVFTGQPVLTADPETILKKLLDKMFSQSTRGGRSQMGKTWKKWVWFCSNMFFVLFCFKGCFEASNSSGCKGSTAAGTVIYDRWSRFQISSCMKWVNATRLVSQTRSCTSMAECSAHCCLPCAPTKENRR